MTAVPIYLWFKQAAAEASVRTVEVKDSAEEALQRVREAVDGLEGRVREGALEGSPILRDGAIHLVLGQYAKLDDAAVLLLLTETAAEGVIPIF